MAERERREVDTVVIGRWLEVRDGPISVDGCGNANREVNVMASESTIGIIWLHKISESQ